MTERIIQIALCLNLALFGQDRDRQPGGGQINSVSGDGFSATVLVMDEGEIRAADPDETFRDGQRFRIRVRAAAGYVYLLLNSAQGEAKVLYPHNSLRERNTLAGGRTSMVPSTGWFRFDEEPGMESIYVIRSDRPIAELETAVRQGGSTSTGMLRKYARSLPSGNDSTEDAGGESADSSPRQSKGVDVEGSNHTWVRKLQLVHDPR